MTKKLSISHSKNIPYKHSLSIAASKSLNDLLDSLSQEQTCNQDVLLSLSFALRNFTNLHRFLELIPLLTTRLVGVEGSLLIPFQDDGTIWRDQLQVMPFEHCQELFRQLVVMEKGMNIGFCFQDKNILFLDKLVQRYLWESKVFATSIVSRGRQRGRLYVFDKKDVVFESDIQRKYIQLVADLTGVAIENDVLFQVIRTHEKVDRQLSIGGEIQSQLLPDHCPRIDGVELAARCRPAFQVGGDYFDFMSISPESVGGAKERDRWALVIGDVMGKGVPAGLLMTMLRGMLRAEVLSGLPPDRILHDLNQLALEDLIQSHRFVTLFYSDFDVSTRILRFANAAHNPPLLWSSQTKLITRLDAPGLLIGLQSDGQYLCGQKTLQPDDVVLYYTDGVTEALGLSGERFDETRLETLLGDFANAGCGAQEILDRLFKRLDGFVGVDHQLEDDASMVVLKVNE